MNTKVLQKIATEYLKKNPLDPRVPAHLEGYWLLFNVYTMMDDPNVTTSALIQQLEQTLARLPAAEVLSNETGPLSLKDFLLYLRRADTLIRRLNKELPAEARR